MSDLQQRLRRAADTLRRTSMPLADLIPLLQQAADALEAQPAQAVPTGFKLLKDTTHDERSWPEDYSNENDCYCNTCVNCLREFIGYKRRVICKVCDASQKGQS